MTPAARLPSWAGAQRLVTGIPPDNTTSSDILQARILIVDDVEANVRLLQRMLLSARYSRVDTCMDPTLVYDLHRRNRYDLILLDLDMPKMDGFEVMESLKELDSDGYVSVVVLTSHPSEKVRALKAGAKDFLTKPFDLTEVLARIANMLEVRMLHLAMRKRHKGLERELAVAAEIYRALLPASLPDCNGYELAAVSRPADETSGDVYDIITRPNGTLMLLVADATGHGIGPALAATQLRSMVRMALRLGASLERIVVEADRQLATDLPSDRFVTAFIGELDPFEHVVQYFAPGQGPLMHWHADSGLAEWRNASAPPFGVATAPFDRPAPMRLGAGDILVLATDGVYERSNAAGDMFGESGLEGVLQDACNTSAAAIAALLQTRLDSFADAHPPQDDATVLILKRTG
jgi:serine phosphatase RsbU (regulator of sigma subunit)